MSLAMRISSILNFVAAVGFVLQCFSMAAFGELKADHLHLSQSEIQIGDLWNSNHENAYFHKHWSSQLDFGQSKEQQHEHKHSDLTQANLNAPAVASGVSYRFGLTPIIVKTFIANASPTLIPFGSIFRPPQV